MNWDLLPPANEVAGRQSFHTCLPVILSTEGGGGCIPACSGATHPTGMHPCLKILSVTLSFLGFVVRSWSLTKEVSSFNYKIFCHWIESKHLEKTQLCGRWFTTVRDIFQEVAPILYKLAKQKGPLLQLCWCNWFLTLLNLWQILISGYCMGKAVRDGCIKNGKSLSSTIAVYGFCNECSNSVTGRYLMRRILLLIVRRATWNQNDLFID